MRNFFALLALAGVFALGCSEVTVQSTPKCCTCKCCQCCNGCKCKGKCCKDCKCPAKPECCDVK